MEKIVMAEPCMKTLNASLWRVGLRIRFQPACMTAERRVSRSAVVGIPIRYGGAPPRVNPPRRPGVDLHQGARPFRAGEWRRGKRSGVGDPPPGAGAGKGPRGEVGWSLSVS